MAFKKIRNMKVYEQSGYRYKSTPTIMLKGQWLKELGFEYGTPICVECSGGKLIITKADGGADTAGREAKADKAVR